MSLAPTRRLVSLALAAITTAGLVMSTTIAAGAAEEPSPEPTPAVTAGDSGDQAQPAPEPAPAPDTDAAAAEPVELVLQPVAASAVPMAQAVSQATVDPGPQPSLDADCGSSLTNYCDWLFEGSDTNTVAGDMNSNSDSDWYKFTASNTATWTFESGTDIASLDLRGRLLNANGTELIKDDNSGPGLDFSFSYALAGGAIYYLEVGTNSGPGLSVMPYVVYAWRPWGDICSANTSTTCSIALTSTTTSAVITNHLETKADVDWYKFTTTVAGVHIFEEFGSGPETDTVGRLLSASGAELATNDNSGWGNHSFHLAYHTAANTTYYLEIKNDSAAAETVSPYTLRVKRQATDDCGETYASHCGPVAVSATPVTFNNRLEDFGILDFDWFELTAQDAGTYTFEGATDPSLEADLRGYLWDAQGVLWTGGGGPNLGPDFSFSFTLNAGEKYYLEVMSPGGQGEILKPYSVTVTLTRSTTAPVIDQVTLAGGAYVGGRLTATVSGRDLAGATLTYQWFRGTTLISGVTGPTYTVQAADAGRDLVVKVTASRTGQPSSTKYSNHVLIFGIASATIKGTAAEGNRLASAVVYQPPGATLTYQWYRGTSAISGARNPTYDLVNADAGQDIVLKVTLTQTGLASAVKYSNHVLVLGASSATLSGSGQPGTVLTVTAPYQPADATVTYTWFRAGRTIPGVTTTTYTVATTDQGADLVVKVTVSKAGLGQSVKYTNHMTLPCPTTCYY
ncbi:MAG: hypothetical protein LBR19_00925 [Bifidobacteriaceae bacterium]|jgi:hypothetical protein|nr:hypothetical protein [Bifidobacteriaceae bacterium]